MVHEARMSSSSSSQSVRTPLAALLASACERPQAPALRFLQADGTLRDLSWGELWRGARAAAGRLREVTAPGGVAAIQLPTGPGFAQALYGCFLAGVTALPMQPPAAANHARQAAILTAARADAVFTAEGLTRLGWPAEPAVAWEVPAGTGAEDDSWGGWAEGLPDPLDIDLPDIDLPAYLQYSSGSLAAPRGVVITHRQAGENVLGITRTLGLTLADSVLSWLPLYHDMGLVGGVLTPLTTGCSTILMPATTFGRDPLSWLQAVSRFRVTVSGAPDFAFRLCAERAARAVEQGWDLSGWEVAFVGSETVRPTTLRRFARGYAPLGFQATAFSPCYGLAEAVLLVSGRRRGAGWQTAEVPGGAPGVPAREVTGCGCPFPGFEVLVADPETRQPVPDGHEGEILVRGPSLAAGYWDAATRTARAFTVPVPHRADGEFLPTGDLGFLRAGELFLTGRQAGRLVIRGRNVSAEALEAAAETAHPALCGRAGVALTVDAADGERLVVVHEAPRRLRRDPEAGRSASLAVRLALAERWGVCPDDVVLLAPNAIPRTSSGKPIRAACRAAYLAGELDRLRLPTASADGARRAQGDPPATPEERVLATLWECHLGIGSVCRNDRFPALGGDSLTALMVVGDAGRLGLALDPADLLRGTTLADLARRATPVATSLGTVGGVRVSGAAQAARSGDGDPGRLAPCRCQGSGLGARPPAGERPGIRGVQPCRTEATGPVDGPGSVGECLPLTPNQREYFRRRPAAEDAWRITAVLDTPELDAGLLREAWAALVARHQSLRLFFPAGEGGEREARLADATRSAPFHLAAPLSAQSPDVPAAGWLADHSDGICLAGGPVAAARFHPAPAGTPGRLWISVHHLACDASSMYILGQELKAICADLAAGGRGELPARSASYAAWVHSLAAILARADTAAERAFWSAQFRQEEEGLGPLAADAQRKAVTIALDRTASQALLQRSPAVYGVGAETVLLAALAAALRDWTGQTATSVYVYGHGRHKAGSLDLSATVGMLVQRYPLRIESPGWADPWCAVAQAAAARSSIPGDGAGYGLLASSSTSPELARLSALAGCDVQFNFLGPRDLQPDLGNGWRVRACGPGPWHWLRGDSPVRLNAYQHAGRIHCQWDQFETDGLDGPRALHTALHGFLAPLLL